MKIIKKNIEIEIQTSSYFCLLNEINYDLEYCLNKFYSDINLNDLIKQIERIPINEKLTNIIKRFLVNREDILGIVHNGTGEHHFLPGWVIKIKIDSRLYTEVLSIFNNKIRGIDVHGYNDGYVDIKFIVANKNSRYIGFCLGE